MRPRTCTKFRRDSFASHVPNSYSVYTIFKAWKMRISRKIIFFYWMFRLKKYLHIVYAKVISSDWNYQHIGQDPHLHHCQQLDVPQVCWFPRRPPSPLESDYRFSHLRFYHLRTILHTLQCTALNLKNFCVHSYRAELQHSSFRCKSTRNLPQTTNTLRHADGETQPRQLQNLTPRDAYSGFS